LALAQAAMGEFYNRIGVLGAHVDIFTKAGITATGLYLFCIGAIMQFFPQLGAKKPAAAQQ
jgi:phosphatidylcholine synthase